MPPSEDEASLGDDEFAIPEDPVEQEGAPLYETTNVTPDTEANPAGPNTAGKTHSSCVAI